MGQLKILVHFYLSNLISFSTWYKNKTVLLKKTNKNKTTTLDAPEPIKLSRM